MNGRRGRAGTLTSLCDWLGYRDDDLQTIMVGKGAKRELVIGRASRGYVVLCRFLPA